MQSIFWGASKKPQDNSASLLPSSSSFLLLLPCAFSPFCNPHPGCNSGSVQALRGWAGVFTPTEQFTFKQFLKVSFKWPWAFWLEI